MTEPQTGPRSRLAVLSLAALGVVYGDIGTSPLYALRESLSPAEHGLALNPENVLGVLSLIVWSLVLLVAVKYVWIVLRADNEGEGGILALMTLVSRCLRRDDPRRHVVIVLGLFGAALLYGDGLITPAISVLSAAEGLKARSPALAPFVVPFAVVVLVVLFSVQKKGTGRIGTFFGPVMLVWFGTLAALGAREILHAPGVLLAFDPMHAVRFFAHNGLKGFLVLGSVVLVVTGGEAVYADMGHFGARPIRIAWFTIVLPALLLNYFGQGALLLREPAALENPLFAMVPPWAVLPMVALATAATTIASQALISGVFSLTHQAVQLRFLPRLQVLHTSATERGQIYLPAMNAALLVGCVFFVVSFGSSSRLAGAYGVAVTATMLLTTLLFTVLLAAGWHAARWKIALFAAVFLTAEGAFFAANLAKLWHGGWIPLLLGAGIYSLMATWKQGQRVLLEALRRTSSAFLKPIEEHILDVRREKPPRLDHPAVYMERFHDLVPPALILNWQHNRALHDPILLLTVETADVPRVPPSERRRVEDLGEGFFRVLLRWGFMEEPDVPEGLKGLVLAGKPLDPDTISYVLGKDAIISTDRASGMARWRERLFSWMRRNEGRATAFYRIPPARAIEFGIQVEI
ncbi:MAG TPA: KUP/HAK/KT family potassium transporter [Thermoanaerobaculia bacterium]|nr:KUP/HAK/KT family potassium transporter [Thermoanaerobaculia bacterium]